MVKLQQLTEFLLNLNLVAAEQIDSWVENPRMVPRGKVVSEGQLVLFTQTYDAIFAIERYPHKRHSAELLFAHVSAWLIENDSERAQLGLSNPQTDVDVLDDKTADIELTIAFEEDITAVLDEDGPISYMGGQYKLADVAIDYVNEADMASE